MRHIYRYNHQQEISVGEDFCSVEDTDIVLFKGVNSICVYNWNVLQQHGLHTVVVMELVNEKV